jgi:Predicted integral membrane protein
MLLLDIVVLWIHIFAAMIFIGGSFFIWLVVWPGVYNYTQDKREHAQIVGKIAKRFAWFTHISLITLIITGLFNLTWYLPSYSALFDSEGGRALLVKMILVVIMIVIIYGNNLYHGKKIVRLSREGKMDEVQKIRKISHMMSFISLALMIAIVLLATSLQFLPT